MSHPTDMTEVPLAQVPRTAQSVTLSVRVTPRSGGVRLHASGDGKQPIIVCNGPSQQVTIGYGAGKLFVEKLPGTTDFEIKIIGWD